MSEENKAELRNDDNSDSEITKDEARESENALTSEDILRYLARKVTELGQGQATLVAAHEKLAASISEIAKDIKALREAPAIFDSFGEVLKKTSSEFPEVDFSIEGIVDGLFK